jgi:lysophospholipase L1-like esterase
MTPRVLCSVGLAVACVALQETGRGQSDLVWATAWTASVQGPYPSGNASAQPDLSLVFPSAAIGARDQSFRLIVRPDVWGSEARIRLSNAFGTRPVTFDGVFLGIQSSGAALVADTNRAVTFERRAVVTIAPGESAWSDPVALSFLRTVTASALDGRKLAVSFHVAGESGPMTWHAKALTTSYLTPPGSGSKGMEAGEAAFRSSTTSWYFLDAVDMKVPSGARVIVAFGDSITDGTGSTLNGDDRWPDVLSRRLHPAHGNAVVVVNAGIGGNRVTGPVDYSAQNPFAGGPPAGQRLDRDVLSLSSVSVVVWLEGINDLNTAAGASVESVRAAMSGIVDRIHMRNVRVFGATLTSALGSAGGSGTPETDVHRKALNDFIRGSAVFDGVVDFDAATIDRSTGMLRDEFVPNSTIGGPGDRLHPNRLGYAAMAQAVDLTSLLAAPGRR